MENQKRDQVVNVHLSRTEIQTIQEALIVYYKVRSFNWLPVFEKSEAREAITNYYEKQHQIDSLATLMENFLEMIDESENS